MTKKQTDRQLYKKKTVKICEHASSKTKQTHAQTKQLHSKQNNYTRGKQNNLNTHTHTQTENRQTNQIKTKPTFDKRWVRGPEENCARLRAFHKLRLTCRKRLFHTHAGVQRDEEKSSSLAALSERQRQRDRESVCMFVQDPMSTF